MTALILNLIPIHGEKGISGAELLAKSNMDAGALWSIMQELERGRLIKCHNRLWNKTEKAKVVA